MLRRALDPIDRISEILFGLIMVLTFTGSLSVAEAGREGTRTMLIGALGCNLAWGIINAVLYLIGGLADKGRVVRALRWSNLVAIVMLFVLGYAFGQLTHRSAWVWGARWSASARCWPA